jgi:organic radical activating enzyme
VSIDGAGFVNIGKSVFVRTKRAGFVSIECSFCENKQSRFCEHTEQCL